MANEFKVKKGLIVDGTNTVLDIQGTQGQLFSVTDSLTGDLFSVSDISGIPILNVNSSGLSTFDGDVSIEGNLEIKSTGSVGLTINADTDNATESDIPFLSFKMDGAMERLRVGVDSSNNPYISTDSDIDLPLKILTGTDNSQCVIFNADNSSAFGGNVFVNQGANLTSQALQVNGFIDITDVTATALRWYNGSTFRGGLGLDDWAHSGSSSDITMHISGDNSFFVSTNNVKRLEIDSSGSTFSHDLTFGSTGGNGAGRLIIQNDTSGNQGTAGYGILKQRDVNKQSIAGQSTHIGGYIWYTIKIPSGYSNSGLGSDVEVVIRTGGRHHNGKTLQKYIISVGNGTTASIGNLNGVNILQTLDSRIAGSYGGGATEAEFYYRTSVANDTGEVILRLYRADREPVTVVEINPQGAWNNDITKTPSLVCHGLGTTYDSSTSKGQINETRPTSNLSTALVIQKAGFEQTTGTNGKFSVSANGPASGVSHEIARFVNLGSLANSSYMYIGASSGTDWRLGKNINGTAGNTNFGIAKHSGTTLALEIDGSNNATFAASLTAGSSGKFQVLGTGYIQLGNCTISASGDNNHIHVTCPTALIPNSTTLANNTRLGTASYRWKDFHSGPGNFLGSVTASADVIAYSDIKLKENIKTLDGSKVLQMRGVSFDRKDNGASSSGVIAQEMQKVAPELVSDDNGTLGVAYGNLTGYLIEAIKDQQKQIDELKKIIKNGNNL